jgi:predicted acyltransferase
MEAIRKVMGSVIQHPFITFFCVLGFSLIMIGVFQGRKLQDKTPEKQAMNVLIIVGLVSFVAAMVGLGMQFRRNSAGQVVIQNNPLYKNQ